MRYLHNIREEYEQYSDVWTNRGKSKLVIFIILCLDTRVAIVALPNQPISSSQQAKWARPY